MRGDHSVWLTVLLVFSVVFAGCAGSFIGTGAGDSPTTNTEPQTLTETETKSATPTATDNGPNVPAPQETQNISITNHLSEEIIVTVQAVTTPVQKLRLTYANGSVRTDARSDYNATMGWPYDLGRGKNLTNVTPVNTTEVARWSTVIAQNETASLPTLANRQNVTYLVVISLSDSGQIVWVELPTCMEPGHSTVTEFELQVGEGTNSHCR